MKTLVEIIEANDSIPKWVIQEETRVHQWIEKSQYVGILTVFDIFVVLFTDELRKHCRTITNNDYKILLFSEYFKRIRIAIDLFGKGYFSEAIAQTRTAFELGKGINAINKGVLGVLDYFGEKRDPAFQSLPEEKQIEILEKYQKQVNSKVDNFDDKGVPNNLKKSLRTFKKTMHISVHRSFTNLIMKIANFSAGTDRNLFGPDLNTLLLEGAANYISFVLLIYIKTWKSSEFFLDDGKDTLQNIIDFIENLYATTPKQFHQDVIQYIQMKY